MCDHKGPTITIAKSNHGNIFGGYTSKSWTSMSASITDENAFLFLIKSDHELTQNKCPLIFNIKKDKRACAIWHGEHHGPTFGDGFDPSIHDNCQRIAEGAIYFCHHTMFDYSGYEDVVLCGGRNNGGPNDIRFKVIEYEVFQIK